MTTKIESGVRTLESAEIITALDSNSITTVKIDNDAITTAKIDDDAVTFDKMANNTEGYLITYDAAGAPANIVTGTSGGALISRGAGSTPLFQGGQWEFVSTSSILNLDTLNITGMNSLYDYKIILDDWVPVTDNQELLLKVGQGTPITTTDYRWSVAAAGMWSNATAANHIQLTDVGIIGSGNDATNTNTTEVTIYYPQSVTRTRVMSRSLIMDTAATPLLHSYMSTGIYDVPTTLISSAHFQLASSGGAGGTNTFKIQGHIIVYRRKRTA